MSSADVASELVTTSGDQPDLSARVARSAGLLTVRRVVVAAMSAMSTAVVAHHFSESEFGSYSAALATFYLMQAACDFGFGTVLARELAARPDQRRPIFRSMVLVASAWSLLIAVVFVGLALGAGIGSPRGLTMVVLVPPVLTAGLGVARQVFFVDYDVATLARLDVITNVILSAGLIAIAVTRPVVWLLGSWTSLVTVGSLFVSARLATRRLVREPVATKMLLREMAGMAAPLGLVSFLASAYFILDLSLDGYLVSAHDLAPYAAATKILSIVVSLPALILGAALPAMATMRGDGAAMSELAARLWHWMAVTLVPLAVGLIVFAPLVVRTLFGSGYAGAVPLVRILMASAIVAMLSAVVGNVMVVRRKGRALLVQNVAALLLNLAGNLVLVPAVGVIASAWMTIVTEVFVCSCSVVSLRHALSFRPMFRSAWRPAIAILLIVAAAAIPWEVPALVLATLLFIVAVSALHGWPREFPIVGRFAR